MISADEFKNELERLSKEEHDKMADIEIKYADKEKEIREDLEKNRLDAEAQQKSLLKDRQT